MIATLDTRSLPSIPPRAIRRTTAPPPPPFPLNLHDFITVMTMESWIHYPCNNQHSRRGTKILAAIAYACTHMLAPTCMQHLPCSDCALSCARGVSPTCQPFPLQYLGVFFSQCQASILIHWPSMRMLTRFMLTEAVNSTSLTHAKSSKG